MIVWKRGQLATEDRRGPSKTAVADPSAGVAERTAMDVGLDAATEARAEGRLVPHHLLTELRTYPRLRNLVLAYLLVEERYDWLVRMRGDLQRAGPKPDEIFWERLQDEFSGLGLRQEFPARLLGGEDAIEEFAELVDDFDHGYASVSEAAEAALNPSQSAQSFEEASNQVKVMRSRLIKLAKRCEELARELLDDLYEAVNMIFAGEGRAVASDDREKTSGRPPADLAPVGAGQYDENRGSGPAKASADDPGAPDVEGHFWTKSKGDT
jgi:hypothetical protein